MKASGIKLLYITLISCSLLLFGCMGSATQDEHSAVCPQPRDTELASAYLAARQNPLPAIEQNISAGKTLFHDSAKPVACEQCHGTRGEGNGPMAKMFNPPPRNFACYETMHAIPDGQLFWIIRNGSIGTSMPAFNQLSDDQIWQLVMYLKTFAVAPQQVSEINSH